MREERRGRKVLEEARGPKQEEKGYVLVRKRDSVKITEELERSGKRAPRKVEKEKDK